MNMAYTPKAMDTDAIELPANLQAVVEVISKNTHEVWARGKMDDGWVFGETLDAQKKTHPCLVSYEQLSESDRQIDRNTTLQVIKCLLKLGARIETGELESWIRV